MRKAILVLLAILIGLPIYASFEGDEWYQINYICSRDNQDIYHFSTIENDGVWTFVPQNGTSSTVYLENPEGLQVLSFNSPSDGLLLYFGLYSVERVYIEYRNCNNQIYTIPHNECLGVNPADYSLPESGVFVVDNQAYDYNGNLSFLVPLDMVWQWDLYVGGQYILSFAQDEDEACHIVNEDNNG